MINGHWYEVLINGLKKKSRYPWLFCFKRQIGCTYCKEIRVLKTIKKRGVEISKEWSMCTVNEGDHTSKQTRLANIRNKIKNMQIHLHINMFIT